jgi:hypothetical protein
MSRTSVQLYRPEPAQHLFHLSHPLLQLRQDPAREPQIGKPGSRHPLEGTRRARPMKSPLTEQPQGPLTSETRNHQNSASARTFTEQSPASMQPEQAPAGRGIGSRERTTVRFRTMTTSTLLCQPPEQAAGQRQCANSHSRAQASPREKTIPKN